MATVTGDIAIDFSGLSNSSPYTNALITPFPNGVQVSSGAAKPISGVGGFISSDSPTGTVIKSRIELNASHPSGDPQGPCILDGSGNGYVFRCQYAETRVFIVNAYVLGARVGAASNGSAPALAELELELDTETGQLISRVNGTLIEDLTDTTYDTGLRAGYFGDFQNNNSAGALSWAGSGYATGPSITTTTDPTVDGAESSITTDGLTGTPTATLGGYSLTLGGTLPNLTYTTDIAAITDNGPFSCPRIGDDLTLSVTGDEGTVTSTVGTSPKAGWAVVELAGTLADETGGLIDKIQTETGLTVAVTDILYYATANSTSISTTGSLTTDAESIPMILIQGGDADTAGNGYALTVVPEAADVPSVGSIRKIGKVSLKKSMKRSMKVAI